jgi:hypothetical protein
MDLFNVIDASWRTYPAAMLALYGLILLAKGPPVGLCWQQGPPEGA